jgi:CDP-diacylglycerol---glycerol-3-phosphate 3-phosphatidyltransferase
MNLPNTLTLLRIFFVPVFVAAMVQEPHNVRLAGFSVGTETLALAAFLAAALTDLLDGYLARKWHQITTVGTLLDPIADKLLISAALISLVQVHIVPGWMVILIIGREFAIAGLRSIAAAEGYVIKASDLGKTKLVTQVIAVTLGILTMGNPSLRPYTLFWMWCVVFFAMASALMYFRKFWRKIDIEVKRRRRRELLAMEREKIRLRTSEAMEKGASRKAARARSRNVPTSAAKRSD